MSWARRVAACQPAPNTACQHRGANAKTIYSNETREARTERSLAGAHLAMLEEVGRQLEFISGTRTRSLKSTRILEANLELGQAPD